MINIIIQKDEAAAVERVLDVLLTNEAASSAMFRDGAERRAAKRVSLKLHWAKGGELAKRCKPAA